MPTTRLEWALIAAIAIILLGQYFQPESQPETLPTPSPEQQLDEAMAAARIEENLLVFPAGHDAILFYAGGLYYIPPRGQRTFGILLTKDRKGRWVGEFPTVLARAGTKLNVRIMRREPSGVQPINQTYILTAPTGILDPEIESLRFVPTASRNTPEQLSN